MTMIPGFRKIDAIRIVFVLVILLFSPWAKGQVGPDKYLVEFTDKNNTPYSVNQPQVFLSQRAIDRRVQQGIAVSSQDFPVNPQYIQAVKQYGVLYLQQSRWMNAIIIKTIDTAALSLIAQLPFVKKVMKSSPPNTQAEHDTTVSLAKRFDFKEEPVVSAASSSQEAMAYSDYGQAFSQIAMLKGTTLHDHGFRGQGVGIAVLDGGFIGSNSMIVFDSLRNTQRLLGTRNFVGGGSWVYQGTSHGSSVLSVMAADQPGVMIGTAPLAEYWLIRTEDISGEYLVEEYNWISGAEWADSAGADIISSSLAYRTFQDSPLPLTWADADGNTAPITIAADIAASKGILVVTSAGNYAQDWNWPHTGFPADADSVLTVGAVDAHGTYAVFSSFGPTADGRIKPDVMARGVATFVAIPGDAIATADGTSFSTPILSGLLACLKQACPDKSNIEILEAVKTSASMAQSPDTLMGYGIPDFSKALQILTGIELFVKPESQLSIFPNPFKSELNVIINEGVESTVLVELTDMQGRVLISKKFHVNSTGEIFLSESLKDLQAGAYLLRVRSRTGIYSGKIFKQ